MTWKLELVILRALALGAAAGMVSCGAEPAGERQAGATAAPTQKTTATRTLKIGDETELEALRTRLRVQVLDVDDPFKSKRERPKPGRRFVAVHVKVTNIGKTAYEDAPINGARLATDIPKGANPSLLAYGKCGAKAFSTRLNLEPGESKEGCVPFQVKRRAKVDAFLFRPNSGYAPDTGKWAVR